MHIQPLKPSASWVQRAVVYLVAALLVALAGLPVGRAAAFIDTSDSRSGNGHNGVTFTAFVRTFARSDAYGWNAYYTEAWMTVTNGGSALCDRSRLFSSGWTQIGNLNWADAPFPFSSGAGQQHDYFNWDYPAASYAARSWWQVDDRFSGSVCDYGGGVGTYRANADTGYVTETVPSP